MQPLTSKKALLTELDLSIARAGMVLYNSHVYGTNEKIDILYILKLERARYRLTVGLGNVATDYASKILTTTRNE